jgi:hypothetical protein
MTMHINDEDVCPVCGAYWNENLFCSNGHPRPAKELSWAELLTLLVLVLLLSVGVIIVMQAMHCGLGNHMVTDNGCVIAHYCMPGWF